MTAATTSLKMQRIGHQITWTGRTVQVEVSRVRRDSDRAAWVVSTHEKVAGTLITDIVCEGFEAGEVDAVKAEVRRQLRRARRIEARGM
jgi:hypothetical protein